jgi:hypothetical protein
VTANQLSIVRGDTFLFTITCTRPDSNGVAQLVDLTGSKIFFTLKYAKADADPGFLQRTSPLSGGFGINILDQTSFKGQAQVILAPADTSALTGDITTFYYDVEVVEANGRVSTVLEDTANVLADVTKAVS